MITTTERHPMTDTASHDLAKEAVLRSALLKVLDKMDKALRPDLAAQINPGERRVPRVGDPRTGPKLGTVVVSDPEPTFKVVNSGKFLQWVSEHHPSAIVNVPTVAEFFTDQVLKAGGVVDKETGELVLPDGVAEHASAPTLTVTPNEHALDLAREFVQANRELTEGIVK